MNENIIEMWCDKIRYEFKTPKTGYLAMLLESMQFQIILPFHMLMLLQINLSVYCTVLNIIKRKYYGEVNIMNFLFYNYIFLEDSSQSAACWNHKKRQNKSRRQSFRTIAFEWWKAACWTYYASGSWPKWCWKGSFFLISYSFLFFVGILYFQFI